MRAEKWASVRTAPLTWSQSRQWHNHQVLPPGERWRRNNLLHWPVSDGLTPDAVRAGVEILTARHEALRSRFGLDERGRRVQWVGAADVIPLECRDLQGVPDADELGREFVQRLTRRPFRLDVEPPWRVGLVTEGAEVRWLALVVHHIVADGMGLSELRREMQAVLLDLQSGRRPSRDPAPVQPADEAVHEAAEKSRRTAAAALAYWDDLTRRAPANAFAATPPADADQGSGEWSLESRQLAAACAAIGRRHRVTEPAVLLGSYAMLLYGYLGNDDQHILLVASNRYRPRVLRAVATLTQLLPVLIDVGLDLPAGALFQRAHKATIGLYRYGRYDEDAVRELLAVRRFERGVNLEITPAFNYLSTGEPHTAGEPPSGRFDDVALGWTPGKGESVSPLHLRALHEGGAIHLALRHEMSLIGAAETEVLLAALVRVVAAAFQGDDPTVGEVLRAAEAPVLSRGPGWRRRGGSWVSDTDTADALLAHAAVEAAVVTDDGPSGVRAHVLVRTGAVSPVEMRAHLVGQLGRTPSAGVPDAFVVHDGRGGAAGSWWLREDDIVAVGDGRKGGVPVTDPAVTALREAFARAHPELDAEWDALPYLSAGGRVAAVGRVLRDLERSGFRGLEYADLVGPRPLVELAAMLRPVKTDARV